MSRRTRQQQERTSPPLLEDTAVENADLDDELARELEVERQRILAAAAVVDRSHAEGDSDEERDDGDDDQDETDPDPDDLPEDEDSADEWQPPEPPSKATRQAKRRRRRASSEDSEDEVASDPLDTEEKPAAKKSKISANGKSKKSNGAKDTPLPANADPSIPTTFSNEEADSFDDEAERVQAEVEAAAAWADVRRRKDIAQHPTNTSSQSTVGPTPPPAPSLTAWLGKGPSASSSSSELASSLPMPTTCASAQIVDRSSLFIGYVYPLTTSSSAYIAALLSHLTRVVHPTVPTSLLPPQFANAPANKRGSSHDMYAYRVLELKRGRAGLSGPDDFSLQEDKEDDGERWGGDRVLKVAREEGASDVLVVVSRWYGGELLGPVRFDHIEGAARAAVEEHIKREEVEELRQRIQYLDRKIVRTKADLQGIPVDREVNKYEELTVEKGQRLWLARQKALEALQKRLASQSQPQAAEGDSETREEATLAATDAEATPAEPQLAEPLLQQPSPTQEITVKPEPVPTDLSNTSPQVKAEPTHSPILVKHEAHTPIPNLAQDKDDSEDKTNVVKLETQEDAEDLTGWDDLS